jgi:prepilin-type N-terminal cleavage/methylation domain-containing protein
MPYGPQDTPGPTPPLRPHHVGLPLAPVRGRPGFSLVELLVVIAILCLLVSLLAPGLRDAKEIVRRVACSSNLHQQGLAMTLYAKANDFRYPYNAVCWSQAPEDWIYWQAGRNVADSVIARYVGSFRARLFHCPSDDFLIRPRVLTEPYNYSYTLNGPFSSNGGWREVRSTDCRRPSEKILVVDEDECSLDDGHWHPDLVGQQWENFLATRHDRHRQEDDARGTAVFADAHAEVITRQYSRDRRHWDPWE